MKALELIDWTMQEARQLTPEHHRPSESDSPPSLDNLLEVLGGERPRPKAHDTVSQTAGAPGIQPIAESPAIAPPSEGVAVPEPDIVPNLAASTQDAPSTSADRGIEAQMSGLLKAVVDPDLHTSQVDRNRAIGLRWAMRDIKNNRLKWWPVNQHDLSTLISMGLVEMRDDAPVLSNAGVSAIV